MLTFNTKKKSKGDPAMPKELAARKQHCIEWMIHPSPVASPCQSGDEGEVGFGEGEQGTVQGCLGWQHSSQTTGMMNVTGGSSSLCCMRKLKLDNILY